MLTLFALAANVFVKYVFFLLSYVSNSNSFPKPLTAEEERHYLLKFRNKDIGARNILIERNLRLVAHVVKKFSQNNSSVDTDDLISIGTIGLIKAISTFDETKGTRLATYAARCIENAMLSQRKQRWGYIF